MANHLAFVVITPVRNEAEHLPRTIDSMRRQTHKPARWVIVDDGSTDATPQLAEQAAAEEPWIKVVHRQDRGYRLAGQGVVDAFYTGYALVQEEAWDFVSKFDGDLSFESTYFERCLAYFEAEPRLGIGGGVCWVERAGQMVSEFPGDPPFHVRGPTKIYRRACWEAIGGLRNVAGWDGLDELKANMLGWETRSFPDIRIFHHRPTGTADGFWKSQRKYGRANYIMGYHPLFMFAKMILRFKQRPYIVSGLAMGCGYVSAWLSGVQQVADPGLIRYIRSQQLQALKGGGSLWSRSQRNAPGTW